MSALRERNSFEKEMNKLEAKKMNKNASYELKKSKKKDKDKQKPWTEKQTLNKGKISKKNL